MEGMGNLNNIAVDGKNSYNKIKETCFNYDNIHAVRKYPLLLSSRYI
jgi:hypothetical protein